MFSPPIISGAISEIVLVHTTIKMEMCFFTKNNVFDTTLNPKIVHHCLSKSFLFALHITYLILLPSAGQVPEYLIFKY